MVGMPLQRRISSRVRQRLLARRGNLLALDMSYTLGKAPPHPAD